MLALFLKVWKFKGNNSIFFWQPWPDDLYKRNHTAFVYPSILLPDRVLHVTTTLCEPRTNTLTAYTSTHTLNSA